MHDAHLVIWPHAACLANTAPHHHADAKGLEEVLADGGRSTDNNLVNISAGNRVLNVSGLCA